MRCILILCEKQKVLGRVNGGYAVSRGVTWCLQLCSALASLAKELFLSCLALSDEQSREQQSQYFISGLRQKKANQKKTKTTRKTETLKKRLLRMTVEERIQQRRESLPRFQTGGTRLFLITPCLQDRITFDWSEDFQRGKKQIFKILILLQTDRLSFTFFIYLMREFIGKLSVFIAEKIAYFSRRQESNQGSVEFADTKIIKKSQTLTSRVMTNN